MQEKSETMLKSVTENVIQTLSALVEDTKLLDQLHKDSQNLVVNSSSIASASDELGATIVSINQNLENTIQASSQAKTLAGTGSAVIDATVVQISSVDEILSSTSIALQNLLKTAEQADRIIKVVNDISSKTDLLALNASIEAARAGAAGKGFAVVAQEVGRLSEKTQASISEIESIIKSIKDNVHEVSTRLTNGVSSAKTSVQEVNRAKSSINDIVRLIHQVDNEVSNIGSAIRDQIQAVSDIGVNITTIAHESVTVDTQLASLSGRVDDLVSRLNQSRENLHGADDTGRLMLEHGKLDHLILINRVRRTLDGRDSAKAEELQEHPCRVKQWLSSVTPESFPEVMRGSIRELESTHVQLHALLAGTLRHHQNKVPAEATKMFEQAIPVLQSLVSLLDTLARAQG